MRAALWMVPSSSRTFPGQSYSSSARSVPSSSARFGSRYRPAHWPRKCTASSLTFSGPRTQRRQAQPHQLEPVEKIRPEYAAGARSGSNNVLLAAMTLTSRLCSRSEPSDLSRLILGKRNRLTCPTGLSESTSSKNRVRLGRAAKLRHLSRASVVRRALAKELPHHEVVRQGSAVDRDERTIAPCAGVVDESCSQLLARPGFALQQHAGIEAGGALSSFRSGAGTPPTRRRMKASGPCRWCPTEPVTYRTLQLAAKRREAPSAGQRDWAEVSKLFRTPSRNRADKILAFQQFRAAARQTGREATLTRRSLACSAIFGSKYR